MGFSLFDHQTQGVELLAEHDSFGLFWEMGTGKTLTMLIHLSNLALAGRVSKVLWLAPKSALGAVDRDFETLRKHGLGYRVDALEPTLTVMNYEKLSRSNSKYRMQVEAVQWSAIVLDESHCVARHQSARTKYIVGSGRNKGLIDQIPYRYAMTGTPVTNSRIEDFWSFMMIAKGGAYFNYGTFEREYLKTRTLGGNSHVHIVTGYKNESDILEKVASYSQSVKKEECLDLPEMMPDNVIEIPWKSKKAKDMYDTAFQENVIECNDEVFDNALVRTLRLRQIASGHVKDQDSSIDVDCYKTDYAMELIEGNQNKTVVFYEFKHSFESMSKALDDQNIPYMFLNGEQKNKNIWMDFQKADPSECRVFLVQYKSGNAGIDLFSASDTIYYEPCSSSTVLDQSRSRTHRNGATRACTFTFLLTKDTIEYDMYLKLKEHEDFSDKVWLELKRNETQQ